ncbi:MAG: PIN domain nuclease, partial [Staphylococcus equorum]|nr:PIN domain nuclease [Staphylococcus equorum]
TVKMDERQLAEIDEVDMKLVYLAKELDGAVVTNDYNLNKVSEFQNVPVLNINELANTLKPVVIPGETMRVQIVKEGTERAQGVAYLDDGTMVVVEEGKYHLNEIRDVVVTSALQTNAGRMIFAKFENGNQAISD